MDPAVCQMMRDAVEPLLAEMKPPFIGAMGFEVGAGGTRGGGGRGGGQRGRAWALRRTRGGNACTGDCTRQ